MNKGEIELKYTPIEEATLRHPDMHPLKVFELHAAFSALIEQGWGDNYVYFNVDKKQLFISLNTFDSEVNIHNDRCIFLQHMHKEEI